MLSSYNFCRYLKNITNCGIRPRLACSQLPLFLIIPHISDYSFYEQHCSFLRTIATFVLRLKLSRVTIIAGNIGQAMVNMKLWLSKSSSSQRPLHGGRGLNSESLACESLLLFSACLNYCNNCFSNLSKAISLWFGIFCRQVFAELNFFFIASFNQIYPNIGQMISLL